MKEYIEISWTAGSIDEARKVARYLVQERLVACAQITPWIESIYMWNNQLETAQESKVTMKAPLENYSSIEKIIIDNSSYELPEIYYRIINGGHKEYLSWITESSPHLATSQVVEK